LVRHGANADDPSGPMSLSSLHAAMTGDVWAAAGLAVPLALAALPIRRACRLTVRDALAQHGARAEAFRPALRRLPMPARDALRRPGRLALSLSLLTAGGVIATTAFNVKRAYEANLERMPEMWHHDL